ncbi:hypothetical protein [Histophilus somni]|uniref:hypothetical protein n=1 Tax=Histophilus somni TaxID=731 RepID=UPI00094AF426|nr:hypothetical protein [Histophilus somni]
MEKLSKSINSIMLDKINFKGFRGSQFWVGYFSARKIKIPDSVDVAIELFEQYFKESLDDFFSINCLAYDDDAYSDPEALIYIDEYNFAKETGFLKPYIGELKNYLDNDDKYEYVPANFLSINFDSENFLLYSKIMMAFTFGKVVGQICFFINPILNVVIYPHDDSGFGVISLSEDKTEAIKFLEFCSLREHINVYIDSDGYLIEI